MKRICAVLIAMLVCTTTAFSAIAAEIPAAQTPPEEVTVPQPFDSPALRDVVTDTKPIKKIGTTPRDAATMLSLSDFEEEIGISRQIYNNILSLDPDMFLYTDTGIENLNGWDTMSDAELNAVKEVAQAITKGCDTADEKILAVTKYVAFNVGYDNDYIYKNYEELNHSAYDVLLNGSAVCLGYSATVSALLQLSDVPCVLIYSPDHAWNMAYNGSRWVLFDTTWFSNSVYENGVLTKRQKFNYDWFDYTIDFAHSNVNHIITDADYTLYNNTIYSFPVNTKISKFEIPSTVTGINEFAFYGCTGVKLTFDGTLSAVGRSAFYNCKKLTGDINIANATAVSDFAFYECSNANIIFGDKIEQIGDAAFYDCADIKGNINISKAKSIGEYAFFDCTGVRGSINIEGAEVIGKCAFYDCSSANIILGDKIEQIGDAAFSDCYKISGEVNLKNTKKVGSYAFCNHSNADIRFGDKLEAVGEYAFFGCSKAKGTLNLKNVETIGTQSFRGCSSLTGIILGDKITAVPNAAFFDCSSVTDVVIPKTITYIDAYAFVNFKNDYYTNIYYNGTKEDWDNISIESPNRALTHSRSIVYNHTPHMDVSDVQITDNTVTVNYEGIPTDEVVYFAEYENGKFVGIKSKPLTKTMTFNLTDEHTNKITFFIFDSFDSFNPATKASSVEF